MTAKQMKGTQTVLARHLWNRRPRRAVQGYSDPDFDLPTRNPDLVNYET